MVEHYPLTIHTIDAQVLFNMFYRMMFQLVLPISRELGFPDPTVAAATVALLRIAESVSYSALLATYCVLYNKARRIDPVLTRTPASPTLTFDTFPIYITALINSIGPIQRKDYIGVWLKGRISYRTVFFPASIEMPRRNLAISQVEFRVRHPP